MMTSLYFIFLICLTRISMICSQGVKVPGISSCIYFGSVDSNCNFKPVAVKDLPQTCTSFFFETLRVDSSYDVYQAFSDNDNVFLDALLQSSKPVYVYYGHWSYANWGYILACMTCNDQNAFDEVAGIKGFLGEHPGITGFLLRNFEPDMACAKEIVGFSENTKRYIEIVKKETSLQIAFAFDCDRFMDYYDNPKFPWLDFVALDSCVDFYVIILTFTNPNCTAEFRHTGMMPSSGNAKYTLEKLTCAIEKSKIPKEKLYFVFPLFPKINIGYNDACVVNYQMLCMFPKDAEGWCSDTQESYYQKGVWAAANGAGFVGRNVDLDDPQNCCGCCPYPSFNAILNGFNGCAPPAPCLQKDRIET